LFNVQNTRRVPVPGFRYLIVGGGMTADAAVRGIRLKDPAGTVALFTSEPHPPYKRPPLSKALWKGDPVESAWLNTPAGNLTMFTSRTVRSLDPVKKLVTDDTGASFEYARLLLATGARPRRLPFDVEGIIYYRTLDDYLALQKLKGGEVVVIGGGFIGSEIAAALALNGTKVTMVFPDDGMCARIFPPGISRFVTSYYESKGVVVLAREGVAALKKEEGKFVARLRSGRELRADGVVAGIGVEPDRSLAHSAGLKTDDGIEVDEFLRTSDTNVFSAGDAASFFNAALGKRMRVEHEDNATTMGECAGRNMAGDAVAYHHMPFFYSDLFDLGYEAVGELDVRHEVVEQWKEENREGVIYYLAYGRVRGVLLWNTWGQVDAARDLIAQKGPFTAGSVRGKLPAKN
jgi:NADPH-dependent 2,4-dienoyl-CoA reductase/sulfur reductase-like enzyme